MSRSIKLSHVVRKLLSRQSDRHTTHRLLYLDHKMVGNGLAVAGDHNDQKSSISLINTALQKKSGIKHVETYTSKSCKVEPSTVCCRFIVAGVFQECDVQRLDGTR